MSSMCPLLHRLDVCHLNLKFISLTVSRRITYLWKELEIGNYLVCWYSILGLPAPLRTPVQLLGMCITWLGEPSNIAWWSASRDVAWLYSLVQVMHLWLRGVLGESIDHIICALNTHPTTSYYHTPAPIYSSHSVYLFQLKYRKIPNISPGLIAVRKHFLGTYIQRGLYSEGILC